MTRNLLRLTAALGILLCTPMRDGTVRLDAPVAEAGLKTFIEKVGGAITGGAEALWNAGAKAVISAADWMKETVLDPLLNLLKQAFLKVIRPALDLIKKADCGKLLDSLFQADKLGTGSWVSRYGATCAHEFNKGFVCNIPQMLVDVPNALEQAAQSAWENRSVCFPVGLVAGGMSPFAAAPILACGAAFLIKEAATRAWSCLKNAPEEAGHVIACGALYAITDQDPPPMCPKNFPAEGGGSAFSRTVTKAVCKLAGAVAFDVVVGLLTGGTSVPASIMKRLKEAVKGATRFIRVKNYIQKGIIGGKALSATPACGATAPKPAWRGWRPLPDPAATEPAVSSWGGGRLDLFYVDAQARLRHKFYEEGRGWSRSEDLGGPFAFGPAAVSRTTGSIDVFAVHHPDKAVWHRSYARGAWSAWKVVGGIAASSPSAASWGANRLDVFVRGTDAALWHRAYDGRWLAWENLRGKLASKPAAVSWGPNRIDIFVRGVDNKLYQKAWANGWTNFIGFGGTITEGPAVASWAPNHLDVYVRNVRNSIEHKVWTGKEWTSFIRHFGTLTSAPAAVSWGRGRIDLFGRGMDGRVWHSFYGKGTEDNRKERMNVAFAQPTKQSSTGFGGAAARAVDGVRSGNWAVGSVTSTAAQSQPWWEVDLGKVFSIGEIEIANRTDCCSDRLANYFVMVSETPFAANALGGILRRRGVWRHHERGATGERLKVKVDRRGRYVRVQLTGQGILSLAEVEVFAAP